MVEYLERIDRMGGAVAAIEDGFQVREIGEAAFAHQRSVDDNQRIVVGVNQYVTESPPIADLLRVDAAAAAEQVERLQEPAPGAGQHGGANQPGPPGGRGPVR